MNPGAERRTAETRKLVDYGRSTWSGHYDYSPEEYDRFSKKYDFLYRHLLPLDKNLRILEIGCAGGRFLNFLKRKGYRNLHGIDTHPEAVEHCRRNVISNAEVADAFSFLGKCQETYDLIVCNHVIEHFSREGSIECVNLMFRALRPGGRLILTTPNATNPWAGYQFFDDLTHDHLYTAESLYYTLAEAGFSEIEIWPESAVPYDIWTLVRYLLWKVGNCI